MFKSSKLEIQLVGHQMASLHMNSSSLLNIISACSPYSGSKTFYKLWVRDFANVIVSTYGW